MLLIGHFDLVEMKLRGALETLASIMPARIFVYNDTWNRVEPNDGSEYETIDFKEILGEEL